MIFQNVGYKGYNGIMNRIDELKQELRTLPEGYISKKHIHGKIRYYLQHREQDKIVSQYIPEKDIAEIRNKIQRRKEIEQELKALEKETTSPLLSRLSPSAMAFTGDVLEEDEVVATFRNGKQIFVNEKRAPLEIARTGDLQDWLASRAIDSQRTNSRLLKKTLRLRNGEDIPAVLRVYARTLTDHFWFRPFKSKVKFKNLSFDNDLYADTALKGITRDTPSKPSFNPQLTLTGSFEKCWKLEEGCWYMYKTGTESEIFSELFCASLCGKLGLPTAVYEKEGPYIKTKNFADQYDFEPLRSIAGDDDNYQNCYPAIYAISPEIAAQYLLLMWFDCLVYNVDRHNENCGFLRNRKTGVVVSLAPNFDNNLALFARSIPASPDRHKDGLIKVFKEFLHKNGVAAKQYSQLKLPVVTQEMVHSITAGMTAPVSDLFLFEYLDNGQKELIRIQDQIRSNLQ